MFRVFTQYYIFDVFYFFSLFPTFAGVSSGWELLSTHSLPLSSFLAPVYKTPQKNQEIMKYFISSHYTFNQQLLKERYNQVLQTIFSGAQPRTDDFQKAPISSCYHTLRQIFL